MCGPVDRDRERDNTNCPQGLQGCAVVGALLSGYGMLTWPVKSPHQWTAAEGQWVVLSLPLLLFATDYDGIIFAKMYIYILKRLAVSKSRRTYKRSPNMRGSVDVVAVPAAS